MLPILVEKEISALQHLGTIGLARWFGQSTTHDLAVAYNEASEKFAL